LGASFFVFPFGAKERLFFMPPHGCPRRGCAAPWAPDPAGGNGRIRFFPRLRECRLLIKMGLFAYEKEGENTEKQVENCGDLW